MIPTPGTPKGRRAPVLVITGTGTAVGKTHLACAILTALGDAGMLVAADKPVESGVDALGVGADASALARHATFHVKHSIPAAYRLRAALGPPQAARAEGVTVSTEHIAARLHALREAAPALLVEGAGGLFSPLSDAVTFADFLATSLAHAPLVLVASDRLGVQHEVLATARAAHVLGLQIALVLLSTPDAPDASTGTNGIELSRHLRPEGTTPCVSLPRDSVEALAKHPRLVDAVRAVLLPALSPS